MSCPAACVNDGLVFVSDSRTNAGIDQLDRDIRENATESLATVKRMRDAADYIGRVSRRIQQKYAEKNRSDSFSPDADFIFGGQIDGAPHKLFHIYPQGNYLSPTELAPFLQIGEQKYGKPILDRIVGVDTDLETVARCGLVSMDSTIRSNASVGPPIELMMYRAGSPGSHTHIVYSEDDPYLRRIREAWAQNLHQAFERLPPICLPPGKVRVVDS